MIQPFADIPASDPEDLELVRQIHAGSRDALDRLVVRHQPWIYNIVLRMLYNPTDAEDATQEILIKLLTKLSTFEGRSSFRTWLYRLVVNHVLNWRRDKLEKAGTTFSEYARALDATPDSDIPDLSSAPADVRLIAAEAQIGCTSGMLLVSKRRAAAGLHPRRNPGREGCRRRRADGDQPRQFSTEAHEGSS